MKIITTLNPFFKVVPRAFSMTTTLTFDNGMVIPFSVFIEGRFLKIVFSNILLFTQGENYSFTLKSENIIIYKGKMMFVKNLTDVQNYSAQTQDTKRWQ